ncbi:cytochrome P450 [Streptomyces zingiberis]|uniref:Cytochrome P450 n=1 Tax=Streptomyces zingiberis TaxID=2053010 RepID=A0ABX1C4A5_9ACTN|nr:cytochrome P450 [Streptomyces zingiberis]
MTGTTTADTDAATRAPGPAGHWLLGSLPEIRRDPLGTFVRVREEYGDIVRLTAGPPGLRAERHCVFSPSGAQQVLASRSADFRKDTAAYHEIAAVLGDGLLTSQDEQYLRQRRLVQPLFTRRRVDGYADGLNEEAGAVVRRWRDTPDGAVDLAEEMSRFTLRAVTRILFGADIESAVDVVRRNFPVLGGHIVRRSFTPVRPPRTWPTPANRSAGRARAALHALCDRIVAERRAEDARRGPGDPAPGTDLLSLLTRAGNDDDGTLTPAEIRDQVLVFLIAGHETTATSLTFALHLLGHHPEVQERAREEVERVLGDRPPTAADLDALPYLTQVLKESMRLYPAAPVFGRNAVRETVIDGVTIPAGGEALVVPWAIHRHPDHWEDPERFDPDRFLPERERDRPRYAWLPFGGGPRACIGQHFSMLESVLALAAFLRAFTIESPAAGITLGVGVTLQIGSPVRARLIPRATD